MPANLILEKLNIGMDIVPVDMSVGTNNGTWLSLKDNERVVFLLSKGAGAVGEPPTITLQQASDVSGTGAKNLTFTTIYTKLGATTPGPWTKVTQAAAATYAPAAGNTVGLIAVEIRAEMLDIANGFRCVRANVAKVGNTAQLGTLVALLGEARYATAPENAPDPTVN